MNYEQLTDQFLIKMFQAVGLDYSMSEIHEYAKQKDWHCTKEWTEEQRDQFTAYMDDELKKRTHWTKKTRHREIGIFLLMWGWKTK